MTVTKSIDRTHADLAQEALWSTDDDDRNKLAHGAAGSSNDVPVESLEIAHEGFQEAGTQPGRLAAWTDVVNHMLSSR